MSQYLKISHFLISLLIGIGLTAACLSHGEELALGPQQGVLLLRNGQLVAGEILLAGDHYDVSVAGGQIHIKRSEVEYFGRSVLDCYERRRTQVEPGKVQGNLELADWCLRLQLYEQAALALADAVDADPLHPRIAVLERRLKLALEQPAAVAVKGAQEGDAPTIHDLDRTVDGLPPKAVEAFTTSIQPVVMNHCSTAGCHGPQSDTSFKLLRISAGRTPSRRATQRNLYAVLSLVDRERPGESPLLTVPTRPHGTVKSAIFTTRETNQYKQLVAWAYQVSNQPVPAGIGVNSELAGPTSRRVARRQQSHKASRAADDSSPGDSQVRQSSAHRHPSEPQRSRDSQGSKDPQASLDDETAAQPVEDVDLFDPEVFNRRYHQNEPE